ncbi:riboflavin synthase [Ruminococcus sp. HUN007]|uniref:riboflavin synthase n=1 Tax=Ruminococcus sp. HUN007 TaxID=1514668 RepID=UPI0005D22642|nr:riboflavin synthase [Ruminococcus sp. HUN007]
MFTGIIEEKGTVANVKKGNVSSRITFRASVVLEDIHEGDSIAVNGVCLTATDITADTFTADVMAETMRRSSLGSLRAGDEVNMERAMLCGGRFGGHIVSGHIDGTGTIASMKREENAVWVKISADSSLLRYIVEKGSVALDGISLTVAAVTDSNFSVSVIPHTGSETTLLSKKPGDRVNIECDMIGKYVEKLLGSNQVETGQVVDNKTGITSEFLARNGFM